MHPLTDDARQTILDHVIEAARLGSEAILEIYATDFAVLQKNDQSPVTLADQRAEAAIIAHLARHLPDIPAIAEEQAESRGVPTDIPARFWLIDPLDGTKEFVKRTGEFTVNIALIDHHRPILGVVGIPVKGLFYAAAGPGTALRFDLGGRRQPIAARTAPPDGLTVACSRSHDDGADLDRFLSGYKIVERKPAGSSLKFCLIAEGAADLYPRLGPTMEWDTAAGHAVLSAAGGRVTTLDGAPFLYGKPGFRNPGFIASGR